MYSMWFSRKLIEKIKKGEVDQANVTTAEDFEEASIKEREQFQPAPRVTGEEPENISKSRGILVVN